MFTASSRLSEIHTSLLQSALPARAVLDETFRNACNTGNIEEVRLLLSSHHKTIDRNTRITMLFEACRNDHADLVSLLLANKNMGLKDDYYPCIHEPWHFIQSIKVAQLVHDHYSQFSEYNEVRSGFSIILSSIRTDQTARIARWFLDSNLVDHQALWIHFVNSSCWGWDGVIFLLDYFNEKSITSEYHIIKRCLRAVHFLSE